MLIVLDRKAFVPLLVDIFHADGVVVIGHQRTEKGLT